MKKYIRIFALILTVLLALAIVSCAKTEDKEADANEETQTEKPEDNSIPVKQRDESEKYDNEGQFVDIVGANDNPDYLLPAYNVEGSTVVFLHVGEVDPPDADKPSTERDIYKITRKTVVTTHEEKLNKFVSMVLSDDSPDWMYEGYQPTLINKGYLQGWDNYIDFSVGLWEELVPSLKNLEVDGHFYTMAQRGARWDLCWYNGAIFEEYGMTNPRELYEQGNWTWETFRESALALTVDLNQDGVNDIWGCAIDDPTMFVIATGRDFVSLNNDGTATNNVESQEVARAMQFYVDLNIKDKVVYNGGDARDLFVLGKVAMFPAGAWHRMVYQDMIVSGDVFFVPYPKETKDGIYYVKESMGSEVLPKGAKNPYGSAAIQCGSRYDRLDLKSQIPMTEEEALEKNNWTLECENWLWDEFYKSDKTPVQITYDMFNVGSFGGDIWLRPKEGEPWATIAAEIAPLINDNIDRVLNVAD